MKAILSLDCQNSNTIHVDFDENMCIDTSIVPNFLEKIENIYNEHLTRVVVDPVIKSIECKVTHLLQVCSCVGALFTGWQYEYLKDKPNMLCLYSSETHHNLVFKSLKKSSCKFEFIFGILKDNERVQADALLAKF